jgi:hypothetical protein
VDLKEGCVRLDPGTTKNREGRLAYLSPRLLAVLQVQAEATRNLERRRGQIIPWVCHRNGLRILRFLGSWTVKLSVEPSVTPAPLRFLTRTGARPPPVSPCSIHTLSMSEGVYSVGVGYTA